MIADWVQHKQPHTVTPVAKDKAARPLPDGDDECFSLAQGINAPVIFLDEQPHYNTKSSIKSALSDLGVLISFYGAIVEDGHEHRRH